MTLYKCTLNSQLLKMLYFPIMTYDNETMKTFDFVVVILINHTAKIVKRKNDEEPKEITCFLVAVL